MLGVETQKDAKTKNQQEAVNVKKEVRMRSTEQPGRKKGATKTSSQGIKIRLQRAGEKRLGNAPPIMKREEKLNSRAEEGLTKTERIRSQEGKRHAQRRQRRHVKTSWSFGQEGGMEGAGQGGGGNQKSCCALKAVTEETAKKKSG